jgi:hypothetical protein
MFLARFSSWEKRGIGPDRFPPPPSHAERFQRAQSLVPEEVLAFIIDVNNEHGIASNPVGLKNYW